MTADEIEVWYKADRVPRMSSEDAVQFLHSMHPRTSFLKTLPHGSCLLDAGAGEGGFEVFRRWPPPPRLDIRMYAYSLVKGAKFDAYDGHETGRWESGPPSFADVRFDAVYCANFIEYLDDAVPFLAWTAERLAAGGRMYIEWPSPFAALLPKREELAKRGVMVGVSNFGDDAGKQRIHDRSRIVSALSSLDFFIEHQGYVSLPYAEEEVLAHVGKGLEDPYAIQLVYWSKTRWAQYLVAVRR